MNPGAEEIIEPNELEVEVPAVDKDGLVVVVDEEAEPDRPAFDKEAIEAQEDEDAKDIEKFPRPIKKRFETLTYHVRERERQIAEEKAQNDALLQYSNGARVALENLAKQNAALQESLRAQAIRTREAELAAAQNEFRAAREAADTEKEIQANQRLAEIAQQRAQLEQYQVPPAWQPPPPPQRTQAEEVIPETARQWVEKNPWFLEDKNMQRHASGYSAFLLSQGVEPESTTYYNRIDAEMRREFPDRFGSSAMNSNAKPMQSAKPVSRPPVATAARTSSGPANGARKVVLTSSQAAAARKLNVPLEEYAKYVHMVKE